MMRSLLSAFALLFAAPAAQAQDWAIDQEASSVGFQTTVFGGPVTADFSRFSAEISLDPADLSTASIQAEVDVSSLTLSSQDYASYALGGDGLAPEDHPTAYFRSNDIRQDGEEYVATGELEIRGATQPLELRFSLEITEGRAVAEGSFLLSRADFGVGASSWGDAAVEATVELHIEADAAP
jgi:polyisoprenoid-binding protein YceI